MAIIGYGSRRAKRLKEQEMIPAKDGTVNKGSPANPEFRALSGIINQYASPRATLAVPGVKLNAPGVMGETPVLNGGRNPEVKKDSYDHLDMYHAILAAKKDGQKVFTWKGRQIAALLKEDVNPPATVAKPSAIPTVTPVNNTIPTSVIPNGPDSRNPMIPQKVSKSEKAYKRNNGDVVVNMSAIDKRTFANVKKAIYTNNGKYFRDNVTNEREGNYLSELFDRSLGTEPLPNDAIGHEKWVSFKDENGTVIRQVKNPNYNPEKEVKQKNAILSRNKRYDTLRKMYGFVYTPDYEKKMGLKRL